MSKPLTQTVRILKPSKISVDDRGRSVWSGPVEETEFELVSTMMLRQLLDTKDQEQKKRLAAAASGKEGVLAQNLTSGTFEIIDDDDLKAALDSADSAPKAIRAADVTDEPLMARADTGDEELSLVSTQALRRMLGQQDDEDTGEHEDAAPKMPAGGFDPYNNA